jgi:putative membrane protein
MIFSFYYGSTAGIYRSGPSAALSSVKNVDLMQIAGLVLISCFIAGILCISAASIVVRFFRKVDQKKMNVFSLALIVIINYLLGGFFGLLVLFASASIGVYAQSANVSRVSCISALIFPTIVALL